MTARGHKPTKRGTPPPTGKSDFDDAPTEIYESGEHGTAKPAEASFTDDAGFKTELDMVPPGASASGSANRTVPGRVGVAGRAAAPGVTTMPDRPGALGRAAPSAGSPSAGSPSAGSPSAGAPSAAAAVPPGVTTMPDRPGAIARSGLPAALPPAPHVAPAASTAQPETSQQIRAISMKTPADPNLKPVAKPERDMPHVKLRAMSEVARAQQPQNLGNLAAPYDPNEARKRTAREMVIWGSLVLILASAIALGVWFLAT